MEVEHAGVIAERGGTGLHSSQEKTDGRQAFVHPAVRTGGEKGRAVHSYPRALCCGEIGGGGRGHERNRELSAAVLTTRGGTSA